MNQSHLLDLYHDADSEYTCVVLCLENQDCFGAQYWRGSGLCQLLPGTSLNGFVSGFNPGIEPVVYKGLYLDFPMNRMTSTYILQAGICLPKIHNVK